MHMWHHVTNHLIISNDKDSNSENRIKLRIHDTHRLEEWMAGQTFDLLSKLRIPMHMGEGGA
jgi:hypothetical protein